MCWLEYAPSAPSQFTNKLSVLGGNFTLGRVSAALARLGDLEVMQLIASIISNLVEGEILQRNDVIQPEADDAKTQAQRHATKSEASRRMEYLPTENVSQDGIPHGEGRVLRCCPRGCTEGEIWKEVAYAYSRNLGIAFQLVDDVLDYECTSATLGKPGNADLQLGLATAPALTMGRVLRDG
ncbi:hypothetical protein D9756_010009 [Leucocoprinus leucothites]|uniref:(2E,6E)-farnesyl diphosphate synthase n=1 Tax=Leucocoprinus leucothites TaxID=201217 RepID=A0A8H5CRU6_9AGAR|nr:hypothetical protein D9756_010009 [Leucoagaricus leucothites]